MSRREKLQQMLADDPQDVFLWYALACEWIKEDNPPATELAFAEVHQRFPEYVPAWFKHAQWLAEQGEESAKSVGQKALEVAQRVGDFHAAGEITAFLAMLE